jgi:hypothetical protein
VWQARHAIIYIPSRKKQDGFACCIDDHGFQREVSKAGRRSVICKHMRASPSVNKTIHVSAVATHTHLLAEQCLFEGQTTQHPRS